MKIYFAHSIEDFGSIYEKKCIELILENYPGYEIIDPKDIGSRIPNDENKGMRYEEEKYFFPMIDISDIIIVAPSWKQKRFTIGVIVEMKYAASKGKKIKIIEGGRIEDIEDIGKYENDIVYHIPGEEPVRIKDMIERYWN